MASKPVILSIVVCVVLVSCQQPETSDNSTPTESLVNTSVFPAQPMQLVAPANLRLSYTGRTVTDSSVFYQVMATYKGESFGFNLSVPKGEAGIAYFSSTGKSSDDLLHFMQETYGRPVDAMARFGDYVPASFLSLGTLGASDSTAPGTQNKLLFRGKTAGDSAELYLDVNEKEHWIELAEKDTIYRARVIGALMQ